MQEIKAKLTAELKGLEHELRVELPREIRTAVAMGDLSENAEYKAALERQAYVKARIAQLRDRLASLATTSLQQIPTDKAGLGSTVTLDQSMRSWGFDRASQEEVDALDAESRKLMTAYVEGVNAALRKYEPIEYRLLRVDPEPWTMADSFAVGYMVAWGITHNWRHEVCRLLLALHVGWERSEQIYPSDV